MAQGCSAGFPGALAEQEVEMGAERGRRSTICCKSSSKGKKRLAGRTMHLKAPQAQELREQPRLEEIRTPHPYCKVLMEKANPHGCLHVSVGSNKTWGATRDTSKCFKAAFVQQKCALKGFEVFLDSSCQENPMQL